MAQVLVRNLDDDVVRRLKARAAANGRSLEAEARALLTAGAGPSHEELMAEIAALRARTKRAGPGEDAAALVRAGREERDRRFERIFGWKR
jgi:plasmid stability protein